MSNWFCDVHVHACIMATLLVGFLGVSGHGNDWEMSGARVSWNKGDYTKVAQPKCDGGKSPDQHVWELRNAM